MSQPGFFDGETSDGGMQGVVVGIVTDNEDPKGLGRVKLQFPWRDADDESYWARIATPMAGNEYGSYFLPEVDDEVLVAFENGDIHRPYVVGSLWNGKQEPPQQNDGDNDVREIRTRSEHRITFDDDRDGDGGSVTIQTSEGHEIVIDDDDGRETIAIRDDSDTNRIVLNSSDDSVVVDAGDTLELSAKNVKIDGDKSVEITGGTTVDVKSKNTVDISGKANVDIDSGGIMSVDSTGPLTIKGAIIRLN
ncbi:Rhs element Vgr protein [Natrialba magadii ATCC 43099]|uniref:Rhs element Vgr protein n=1 Tax=Natrialba magadii (strain ATCC 43099 / DSM 3394 / CCM 3739 / CIP 104546 / IAM 13178 / JCM 8861 / NBRC 102185 / NCIMB 2190 / MS3) TaxID=547559 RepID=D3SZZ6_NATMM|nr:phage baseplate assembly protein V [Natrialba magadii]ADD04354.1 Rhs element Vgr protein [Natrialba magadii ATCC 43099]ELY26079.1 Rhs element Vgr protein [Natrialba magadii ATCC 43099]